MIEFSVPLPPRSCSPNGNKGSWRMKYSGSTRYRTLSRLFAANALMQCDTKPRRVRLHLEFCLKGGRKEAFYGYQPRDVDNAIAAFKGAKDGIADALGIPDSARFMELGAVTLRVDVGPFVRVRIEVLE